MRRLNDGLRLALLTAWGGKCAWCELPISFSDMEVDHVIPKGLGDEARAAALRSQSLAADYDVHSLENLVPSCRRCNRRKGMALAPSTAAVSMLLKRARERAPSITDIAASLAKRRAVEKAAAVVRANADVISDPEALEAAAKVLDAEFREVTGEPVGQLYSTVEDEPWNAGGRSVRTITEPPRRRLALRRRGFKAVAVSPTGLHLATVGSDRTARIWDVRSGRQTAELPHDSAIRAVSFSADGTEVVTAGDGRAHVWRLAGAERVSQVNLSPGTLLRFSRGGRLLAVVNMPVFAATVIRVWDVYGEVVSHEFTHEGEVQALAFDDAGNYLATSGRWHTAHVWDLSSGRQASRLHHPERSRTVYRKGVPSDEPHYDSVTAVAFSPDGRLLATGSSDETARIWEIPSRRLLAELSHRGSVRAVAYSADGRLLATASSRHTAELWHLPTREPIAYLDHRGWVGAVAFDPSDRYVVTRQHDGTVEIWEPKVQWPAAREGR